MRRRGRPRGEVGAVRIARLRDHVSGGLDEPVPLAAGEGDVRAGGGVADALRCGGAQDDLHVGGVVRTPCPPNTTSAITDLGWQVRLTTRAQAVFGSVKPSPSTPELETSQAP